MANTEDAEHFELLDNIYAPYLAGYVAGRTERVSSIDFEGIELRRLYAYALGVQDSKNSQQFGLPSKVHAKVLEQTTINDLPTAASHVYRMYLTAWVQSRINDPNDNYFKNIVTDDWEPRDALACAYAMDSTQLLKEEMLQQMIKSACWG